MKKIEPLLIHRLKDWNIIWREYQWRTIV